MGKNKLSQVKAKTVVSKPMSNVGGLVPLSPPRVEAYSYKYGDYLADYEKYRIAFEKLRVKKASTTNKSRSSVDVPDNVPGYVLKTKSGPVLVEKSAVWSTKQLPFNKQRKLVVEELEVQPAIYDIVDDETRPFTSILSQGVEVPVLLPEHIPVDRSSNIVHSKSSAKVDMLSEDEEASTPVTRGPLPSKVSKPKKVVPKRNVKKSQRALKSELKAVTMAASLATTLAKGEKAAARAGRSIVKTSDGWNLVVKGQRKTTAVPKAMVPKTLGYSDSYAGKVASFVLANNPATLIHMASTLSPSAGSELEALSEFDLNKVVPILYKYTIPVAIFKLD
jgi:hypothetical protein